LNLLYNKTWLKFQKSWFIHNPPPRKKGVLPQDIPADVVDPLVEKVLQMPEEIFLEVGPVKKYEFPKGRGCFETVLCAECGERVFADKVTESDGGVVCVPCSEK